MEAWDEWVKGGKGVLSVAEGKVSRVNSQGKKEE